MSVQWAGFGPELLLRLDRSRAVPLRVQLEGELASELGVSRGLVLESYSQLQAEGYLTSRGGSATRVADGAHEPPPPVPAAAPPRRWAVDFKPGVPDLTTFPRRDWAWAMREALAT